MKYFKFIIIPFIVLVISLTVSCERDDICPASTSTTPKLVIEFLDEDNTENKKNVTNLVIADLNGKVYATFSQTATISLPLRTEDSLTGEMATSTQFILHKEFSIDDNDTPEDETDDIIGGNQDIITINYTPKLIFVSRACGYKTIFEIVSIDFDDTDTDKWILNKESANDNQPIEDETTTHFNLLH